MSAEMIQREFELGDFVLTKDNRLAIVSCKVVQDAVMIEVFMNGTGAKKLVSRYDLRRVRIQPCVKIYDFETGELIVERNETLWA